MYTIFYPLSLPHVYFSRKRFCFIASANLGRDLYDFSVVLLYMTYKYSLEFDDNQRGIISAMTV